ncbi:hypothetical protein C4D27_11210 [Clostridium perfringens]
MSVNFVCNNIFDNNHILYTYKYLGKEELFISIRNSTCEISNKLDIVDLEVLKSIYYFRCLTIKQIYNKFYKNKYNYSDFLSIKIRYFLTNELIEEVYFNINNIACFLTSTGVELVRYHCKLPSNILDEKNKVIKRGYYRAGELKIQEKLINHQIHLNQFILDFDKYMYKLNTALKDNMKLTYNYYDEKHVSKYIDIRPDGLIELIDVDLFLEMDMCTESKKQLKDKWKHYRSFLFNRKNKLNKKIIVLFIIDGTDSIENRKKLVKHTISSMIMDVFDNNFELYIGTRNEILSLLFQHLILKIIQSSYKMEEIKKELQKHDFHISNGDVFNRHLSNNNYEYYIRKINNRNTIVVQNGKIQEFLFDEYLYSPFSVLNKIFYHSRNSSCFKHDYQRDISYIILVNDINNLYSDLKTVDLTDIKDVYFTTLERLQKRPLYEALFQIDSMGNLYHFKNYGLQGRIFEYCLED